MEGYNYRLQLVYVEPLPWFHFLQFRYSYQYRVNNSDRFVYNWNKELEEFAPDYDEDASNCFENQYSNHLFNLAVRTSRKKYNYNIGADFEPQKSVSRSLLERQLRQKNRCESLFLIFLLPSISVISSPNVPVCRLYIGEKPSAEYTRPSTGDGPHQPVEYPCR